MWLSIYFRGMENNARMVGCVNGEIVWLVQGVEKRNGRLYGKIRGLGLTIVGLSWKNIHEDEICMGV